MDLITKGAVALLNSGKKEILTVEVKNIKQTRGIVSFDIWDQSMKIRGFVNLDTRPECDIVRNGTEHGQGKFLVSISQYACSFLNQTKLIEILQLTTPPPLNPSKTHLPTQQAPPSPNNPAQQPYKTKISHKGQFSHSNQNTRGYPSQHDETIQKKLEVISAERMKQFQKISDLYVDFQNWQILVRVMDSSYKEFNSKQGKLIKVLNLELMDKTSVKVQATLFGEEAREEFQRIKKGTVYRVAKGQIKEHFYSHTLSQDFSKLNIVLFKDSQIVEVQDVPQIPNSNQYALTLKEVISEMSYDRYYDILTYLLQIGQEKEIEKAGGKTVAKRHFVVGDPESRRCVDCIIWSKNLKVQQSWLLKPIILKSFRLNSYRDQLSLCSVFRSQIQLRTNCRISKYQNLVPDMQFMDINSKSVIIKPQPSQSKHTEHRTIRELQNQLSFLPSMTSLSSELDVWVTFIRLTGKWFYGACNNPRCKKATQPFNKCPYCGSYNERIGKRYMIPVELSDFTGSLWTTAFDDFANQLFKGYKLDELENWDEVKLKELGEVHLYRQFKIRVVTKKEGEFLVRHSVGGKVTELPVESSLKANLNKIKCAIQTE